MKKDKNPQSFPQNLHEKTGTDEIRISVYLADKLFTLSNNLLLSNERKAAESKRYSEVEAHSSPSEQREKIRAAKCRSVERCIRDRSGTRSSDQEKICERERPA